MSSRPDRRRAARDAHAAGFPFSYQVYGLNVHSELELPELVPAKGTAADVTIRFGVVPETVENALGSWSWCTASRTEFIFTIEGVGRYHVADGCSITVDRRVGVSEGPPAADVRLWLLGSAFGALLHQRGLLPLHVSAVKTPHGVWAFTGDSGEGKSTLAGFLCRNHHWELVSDDVSVVDCVAGEVRIHPGPRKLKLWADALDQLNLPEGRRVRDLSNTEKFQLYLDAANQHEKLALNALVVLESVPDDQRPSLERLSGAEAFTACAGAVYRPGYHGLFKHPERAMADLIPLCQSIAVYRFCRPRSLSAFEENLQPLLQRIAGVQPECG